MIAQARGDLKDFQIPSLDGLRAASIAIVVAAHLGLAERIPGNSASPSSSS